MRVKIIARHHKESSVEAPSKHLYCATAEGRGPGVANEPTHNHFARLAIDERSSRSLISVTLKMDVSNGVMQMLLLLGVALFVRVKVLARKVQARGKAAESLPSGFTVVRFVRVIRTEEHPALRPRAGMAATQPLPPPEVE